MISVCIFAPIAEAATINAALEARGHGPITLSIPMRGMVRVESIEQATHLGCHWWMHGEADAVVAVCKAIAPNVRVVASDELQDAEKQDSRGFELFDAQAGDYIYVPVDPRLIEGLTIGLGELATPQRGLPYAPIIVHPMADKDARLWPLLQLRSEDVVPISLAANSQPLVDVLQAFVDGGGLTAEERDKIVADVGRAATTGETVRLADMIPDSWRPHIKSREQAEAAGYFGDRSGD